MLATSTVVRAACSLDPRSHASSMSTFAPLPPFASTRLASTSPPSPPVRRTVSACAASLVVLIAACGSDETSTPDTGLDVTVLDTTEGDDVSDAGEDTDPGVVLAPCADNTDCLGGEVCRSGFCREACEEGALCEGPLPVCDFALGYCVGCVQTEDCEDGRICRNQQCVQPQCTVAADCRGGETCREGECVSIDARICSPETSRCEGNERVVCSRDGTRETRTVCEDVCVTRDGDATCDVRICTPGSTGCIDATQAFVCDESGTRQNPLPCAGSRVCDEGVCVTPVCEAGVTACEGNFVSACNEDGTAAERTDCSACDEPNGCACIDAACIPRICRPGTARCVGNSSQVCADDGMAFAAPLACGDDQCVAGRCVSSSCTVGATECAGDVLLTCAADGTSRTQRNCADTGAICDEGACVANVCTPGALRCVNETTVGTCDSRGASESTSTCDDGLTCRDGVCSDRLCDPAEPPFCRDGSRFRCNDDGSAVRRIEVCDPDQICTAEGCVTEGCGSAVIRCRNAESGLSLVAPYVVPLGTEVECSIVGYEGGVRWTQIDDGRIPLGLRNANTRILTFRAVQRGTSRLRATLSASGTSCATLETTVETQGGTNGLALVLDRGPTGTGSFADIDLHLRHPDGCFDQAPLSVSWRNRTPSWTTDPAFGNPRLDLDLIATAGVEVIWFPRPTPNLAYQVAAFHYSTGGGQTEVTLHVIWRGDLVETFTFPLNATNRFWQGPRLTVRTNNALAIEGEPFTGPGLVCGE